MNHSVMNQTNRTAIKTTPPFFHLNNEVEKNVMRGTQKSSDTIHDELSSLGKWNGFNNGTDFLCFVSMFGSPIMGHD